MNNAMFQIARLESRITNTSHILHLLLTIVTAGLWIPVWIIVAIRRGVINASIRNEIRKWEKHL